MKKLLNSNVKKHSHFHNNAIEIKNYTFGYTKGKKHLDNLTVNIHKGEWTTILGPNGSGKSTLAKNLVRILKSKKGSIKLFGKDIKNYKNKEYAQKVAYIPQIIEIPDGTSVFDYVSYGRNPWLGFTASLSKIDIEIIKESMIKAGCWKWRKKMCEDLSGGERQKVVFAMIMAQDAEIILLDEPTTYLDIRAQYELLELMAEVHTEGKTVVTVLHDVNQAVQYSDEIIILNKGKLYDYGVPNKVVTKKMLAEVYGVHTKLTLDDELKYITDVKLLDVNNFGEYVISKVKESNSKKRKKIKK